MAEPEQQTAEAQKEEPLPQTAEAASSPEVAKLLAHPEETAEADALPEKGSIDWWLLIIMILLLILGLIMVLSASGIIGETDHHDRYFFFKRQFVYACAGGVALALAANLKQEWILSRKVIWCFLLIGCLIPLILTLTPMGVTLNKASRWLRLGPITIQPMEFLKIGMALYLANFMSNKHEYLKTWKRGFMPPIIVTMLFCGVLLLQPDFGSCLVLCALLGIMLFVAGAHFGYILSVIPIGLVGLGCLAYFSTYRFNRLMAFLDPFNKEYMRTISYQLVQSLLSIGSGSFFGVGLGASRQKMLSLLPEAQTDFIMAILAEELGFIGVSGVIILFMFFFWRCWRIVIGQEDARCRYAALALSAVLCMAVLMNLGVVMGALPPKGVPMPLFSYGGSNLLATMTITGLLLNFSRTSRFSRKQAAVKKEQADSQ